MNADSDVCPVYYGKQKTEQYRKHLVKMRK